MMVPRTVKGHKGFDCIVPLVTSEQEDGTEQYGMLLNMGWIPLENKKVDLIVLDVGLPDRNGFDLCKDIRDRITEP